MSNAFPNRAFSRRVAFEALGPHSTTAEGIMIWSKFLPRREAASAASSARRWWTAAAALALVVCSTAPLLAQTGQINGTITSTGTGRPLPDVQVSVTGTRLGAVTNQDGRFVIANVPAGERQVVAQLIGYGEERSTVTVTTGAAVTVNFEMRVRAVELEGLVVTGTAIAARKREVGNSIALITAEKIESIPGVGVEDILRGRTLGVTVSGSTNQPGAGSRLMLRGVNSVYGRQEPLVYVDGVRIFSDAWESSNGSLQGAESVTGLSGINPSDIERIEVIKGAAASTLYGTEASAGVIQIFTKRGRAGAPRWTLNMETTMARPGHVGPEEDPTGLQVNRCDIRGPSWPEAEPLDPTCPASGSWLRNGWGRSVDLNVRGGSEDVTYFLSTGYEQETSVINWEDGDGAQSFNLRANFGFNGFEDFQIRFNTNYRRQDIDWIPQGDDDEGLLYNVVRAFDDNTDNQDALVFDKISNQIINQFNFSSNVSWAQRDNLAHRLNIGVDWSNSHYITDRPFEYFDNPEGTRTVDIENRRLITVDYAGSYSSGIPGLSDAFTSVLSVGGQFTANEDTGNRTDVNTAPGPGNWTLINYQNRTNTNEDYQGRRSGGFFLQEQLGWANRLFLTGGFRADSHSDFGEDLDHKYYFLIYPKLQATYTLSDHSFWPSWWPTARLRGAYGESGEPPPPGVQIVQFQASSLADENALGFIIINQGNPKIGPEITKEWEFGFDGALFNDRLSYEFTRYLRKTVKGLIPIDPPPSNGIAESVFLNIGDWSGHGYEGALEFLAFDRPSLQLNLSAKYQYNDTKMGTLSNDATETLNLGYENRYKPGVTMPSYINFRQTNPDAMGELPVYSDTMEVFGPTYPPHEVSLGVTATLWNRLTLDTFLFSQWGHLLLDDMAQEMQEAGGYWPTCKAIDQQVQAFLNQEPGSSIADLRSRDIARCSQAYTNNYDWVTDADFIRLGTVSASYRLPESWLRRLSGRISQATLQLQAYNLWIWTEFEGVHPDALVNTAAEIDRAAGFILPPPKRFTLSLRANF
jgi:TonB-dependent SusC/RagA subfamily outer membrane receptor